MPIKKSIKSIKVVIGTALKREIYFVDINETPRNFLDDHGIDYISKSLSLNNGFLKKDNIDKTFAELGIFDTCRLLEV